MDALHACIKNNIVENVIVLDAQNIDIITTVKETFEYDLVIEASDPLTSVGWAYDPKVNRCINPNPMPELDTTTDPDALPAPN